MPLSADQRTMVSSLYFSLHMVSTHLPAILHPIPHHHVLSTTPRRYHHQRNIPITATSNPIPDHRVPAPTPPRHHNQPIYSTPTTHPIHHHHLLPDSPNDSDHVHSTTNKNHPLCEHHHLQLSPTIKLHHPSNNSTTTHTNTQRNATICAMQTQSFHLLGNSPTTHSTNPTKTQHTKTQRQPTTTLPKTTQQRNTRQHQPHLLHQQLHQPHLNASPNPLPLQHAKTNTTSNNLR